MAPRWKGGDQGEAVLFAALYRNLVSAAIKDGATTLALPSFATGAFGMPVATAARLAVQALTGGLVDSWGHSSTPLRMVRWWVTSEPTLTAYREAIDRGHQRLRPVRWSERTFAGSDDEPTSRTRPLPFERTIDDDDLTLLRAGLPALEMEEKWWAIDRADRVHIHRSWTGFEIFSLRIRPRPDGEPGAVLDELQVCDDRDRYTADDDEALGTLDHVLQHIIRQPARAS